MIYQEKLTGLGVLSLVPVRPDRHATLLHGWVTQPRNSFCGMGSHSVDDVRGIYAFVDSLPTHHAYLIEIDGEPVVPDKRAQLAFLTRTRFAAHHPG